MLQAENSVLKSQNFQSYSNQSRLNQSLYESNRAQDSSIQRIANDLSFGYALRTEDLSYGYSHRRGNGWVAKAASANSLGGYALYMRQRPTSNFEKWNLTHSSALIQWTHWTSDHPTINDATLSQILEAERSLNFDLLGQGRIGVSFIGTPRTLEDVTFVVTNFCFACPIWNQGKYLDINTIAGWTVVAASRYYPNLGSTRDGFAIYWKLNAGIQYAMWLLDDAFTYKFGFEVAQVGPYESRFNFDWNGNGVIGS